MAETVSKPINYKERYIEIDQTIANLEKLSVDTITVHKGSLINYLRLAKNYCAVKVQAEIDEKEGR